MFVRGIAAGRSRCTQLRMEVQVRADGIRLRRRRRSYFLLKSGADPNAFDKSGVSPLHKAVRTRCADAVRTLIDCGADPALPNKNGSTPMLLATQNTGRGGTGSEEAKLQQQEIVRLLEERVR